MSDNSSKIETGSEDWRIVTFIAFRRGYRFAHRKDLTSLVSQLPEGAVACSSSFIAGKDHIDLVLNQSAECWARDIFLARNRSIDLLMRITCQTQISKAVHASGIESCNDVALFGLAKDSSNILFAESLVKKLGAFRNDKLLDLNSKKADFLKRFHSLPSWIDKEKIPQLLQEKSAILVLSK